MSLVTALKNRRKIKNTRRKSLKKKEILSLFQVKTCPLNNITMKHGISPKNKNMKLKNCQNKGMKWKYSNQRSSICFMSRNNLFKNLSPQLKT